MTFRPIWCGFLKSIYIYTVFLTRPFLNTTPFPARKNGTKILMLCWPIHRLCRRPVESDRIKDFPCKLTVLKFCLLIIFWSIYGLTAEPVLSCRKELFLNQIKPIKRCVNYWLKTGFWRLFLYLPEFSTLTPE